MKTATTPTAEQAKAEVLAWVEDRAGKAETVQELLISLHNEYMISEISIGSSGTLMQYVTIEDTNMDIWQYIGIVFDLTKKLHEQSPRFYLDLLPLIRR